MQLSPIFDFSSSIHKLSTEGMKMILRLALYVGTGHFGSTPKSVLHGSTDEKYIFNKEASERVWNILIQGPCWPGVQQPTCMYQCTLLELLSVQCLCFSSACSPGLHLFIVRKTRISPFLNTHAVKSIQRLPSILQSGSTVVAA